MTNCDFLNPLRDPAWCWLRASGIRAQEQLPPSRREDGLAGFKWIRQAVRFQNEDAQAQTGLARHTLSRQWPALFWAHHIWSQRSPYRAIVEARIMTGADNLTIGFACGLAPTVVEAYEAVFFNVRDRLPHRDLVAKLLLSRAIDPGLQGRDYDLIWKLYGYFYGNEALSAVSDGFVDASHVASSDTVGAALEADAISTLKLKAMLAAKTVGVNPQTHLDLLAAFTKFVEVERTSDAAGHQKNQIVEHVEAMFSALRFDVAGRDPHTGQLVDTPLSRATARFRAKGVELSFEEQLQIAAGLPSPSAEEAMTFEWPKPNPGTSS